MTTAQHRARLAGLRGRFASLPKIHGRTMRENTELNRLTGVAWCSYQELISRRSLEPLGAAATEETIIRDAHKHQLLLITSFGLRADTAPEKVTDNERIELHQVFGPTHPGVSRLGYTAHSYHWHEDKHPDALALYVRLCAEEYL